MAWRKGKTHPSPGSRCGNVLCRERSGKVVSESSALCLAAICQKAAEGSPSRAWYHSCPLHVTNMCQVHSADWFATFQHVASDGERSETEPSAMDSLDMWPAFSTRGTSPRTTAIHMVSNHFAKNHNTIIRHMNFKLINGAVRPATIVGWPKLGSEDIPFGQSRGTLEPGTDHCRAPLLDGVDSTAAGQVCDPVCLFDLSVDPTESNNLANNTKYASVVEQLQKLLAEAAASGPPASYIDLGSKTVTEIMCNQSKEYGFLEPINWK